MCKIKLVVIHTNCIKFKFLHFKALIKEFCVEGHYFTQASAPQQCGFQAYSGAHFSSSC